MVFHTFNWCWRSCLCYFDNLIVWLAFIDHIIWDEMPHRIKIFNLINSRPGRTSCSPRWSGWRHTQGRGWRPTSVCCCRWCVQVIVGLAVALGKTWGNSRSLRSRLTRTKWCITRASISPVRWKSNWPSRCSVKVSGRKNKPTSPVAEQGSNSVRITDLSLPQVCHNRSLLWEHFNCLKYDSRHEGSESCICGTVGFFLAHCSGSQRETVLGPNWPFRLLFLHVSASLYALFHLTMSSVGQE